MLNKCGVSFNQEDHTYTLNGKILQGITGMIGRQLFPDKYTNIPKYILDKACANGSLVHETCELIDSLGVTSLIPECINYMKLKKEYDLNVLENEYLVTDREYFASAIDIVLADYSLADIKTTSKLDMEYLSWQLSIYAYLFEMQNPTLKVPHLYAIWIRKTERKFIEVKRIPIEVVKELLQCEINHKQFKRQRS